MQGGKLSLSPRVVGAVAAVLAALAGLAVGVWYYPPILLYAVITAAALGTYAAVYVMVLSALRSQRALNAPARDRSRDEPQASLTSAIAQVPPRDALR